MLALLLAAALAAGDGATAAPPASPDGAAAGREVRFSADTISYDDDAQIVTATGDVVMVSEGRRLRADRVTWNQRTGAVEASGDVVSTDASGNRLYGKAGSFDDGLATGSASGVLLVLDTGGRLAADEISRQGDRVVATRAAYTPCGVTRADGCPTRPIWSITAKSAVRDPVRHRVYYHDAQFRLFGRAVLWLPAISHPDGTGNGNPSGLLVPVTRYNKVTGFRVSEPIRLQLAPDRQLTLTPSLFTAADPMLEVDYRALTSAGAFEIDAYATHSAADPGTAATPRNGSFRGYLSSTAQFQLGPYWTLSESIRAVTDKAFLRLYSVSNDDRLRSTVAAERIDDDSYLSIAGWATQSLDVGATGASQPIALPAIDYRRRWEEGALGTVEVEGNSLGILRRDGEDTQRAFAALRWDLRRVTPLGQLVTLTGYARGDVYHASDVAEAVAPSYAGEAGWSSRGIVAAAIDVQWPFTGTLMGGTQTLTPRVQLVASPRTANTIIPNEDSRVVDLEDDNLFALNRFAGYDRWEDDTRLTYGLDWAYTRPKLAVEGSIGESYRLTQPSPIFVSGTGLTGTLSDVVGRIDVKYGSFVELTDRFRIDKGDLAIRRNEVDLTLGSRKTYLILSYFNLDRNIDTLAEDLRDWEEASVGARVQVTANWSLYGSAIVDLTTKQQDPLSSSDGFTPVRERLGVQYDTRCISLGLGFQRNYDTTGVLSGNSFLFTVALKNVGK